VFNSTPGLPREIANMAGPSRARVGSLRVAQNYADYEKNSLQLQFDLRADLRAFEPEKMRKVPELQSDVGRFRMQCGPQDL
jgi:hypothetical protein